MTDFDRINLSELRFGDVVEGERGDKHVVVRPLYGHRTVGAITLLGPALDREHQVGALIEIYSSWNARRVVLIDE